MKIFIVPIGFSLCVSIFSGIIGYLLFLVFIFPEMVDEILDTISKITGYRCPINFKVK
jgi:hypothetical protein